MYSIEPAWIDTTGRTRTWSLLDANGAAMAEVTTKRVAVKLADTLNETASNEDNPGYPPADWKPEEETPAFVPRPKPHAPASCIACKIANIFGPPTCNLCREAKNAQRLAVQVLPALVGYQYPTLAERLAESMKDDRH